MHDMGGVEGYGPVPYVPEERVRVDSRWEALAGAALFALMRAGRTNIDAHRHRIERIDPRSYLPIGYWGRWLAAVEVALVEQGIASTAEVEAAVRALGVDPAATTPPPSLQPTEGLEATRDGDPGFVRPIDRPPRYTVGEPVVTLDHAPRRGHHRLPRYARGRRGRVVRVYPAFTLPDTMAHGEGEQPTHVYAVAFDATELWGPDADPAQRCHLDLFETYLRPDEDGPASPAATENRGARP